MTNDQCCALCELWDVDGTCIMEQQSVPAWLLNRRNGNDGRDCGDFRPNDGSDMMGYEEDR